MVDIGKINKLVITKFAAQGAYLDGSEDGEILLPKKYVPDESKAGDELEVFICYDSEDRLMATTETPKAQVGEFALLKIVAIEKVGAFLDWGLPKDLFLPYSEQTHYLDLDQDVLVYLYLDKSHRISSTMKIDKFLDKSPAGLTEGQAVELLVYDKTDLGYKAIINGKYSGMIYKNEIFKPLQYGQKTQGYIKKLREDGKIDLLLSKTGHQGADDIGPQILELLNQKNGFIDITDKTSPETIYKLFGASKKKFKIALSGLYKKRLISIHDDGIRLIKNSEAKPS